MSSNVREDVFDGLLAVAFNEYLEEELSKLPSDEELAEIYPIPIKQMRKMQRYARRLRYRTIKPLIYLKRVAIACLIIISLTIAVLAVSPTVRKTIKETFFSKPQKVTTTVTHAENAIKIDFDVPNTATKIPFDIYQLNIGYVPDGFELSDSREDEYTRVYVYNNAEGEHLTISINIPWMTSYELNNEGFDYQEFKINGYDGCMSYNSELGTGTLVFSNDLFSVATSGVVEKSELFTIARNIE